MEALHINLNRFEELLENNIITFQYKKKDGSIREAKGTKNSKYIVSLCPFDLERDSIKFEKEPIDKLVELRYEDVNDYAMSNGLSLLLVPTDDKHYYFVPLKREKKYSPDVINYFDIDKKDYRSFRIDNYIGVIDMTVIKNDEEDVIDIENIDIEDVK